jgi:hypothetical protein
MKSLLTKLRLVSAFALVGCALAGASLGWAHLCFDVHVPGALIGALAGIFVVRGGRLESSLENRATSH